MKALVLAAALVLLAATANAQDIGPVRPDVQLQSPTSMQALGTFISDGTWQACLIFDGSDHLDPLNWFECKPITETSGITTDHLVIVSSTGGNVVVRGIVVNAANVPSEPSANKKTVLSIPAGGTILSDSTEAQEALGTEDVV